jgi:LacI family transcriptional regulator
MAKRPTIIDVARHAGVSKSTVSLVITGSPLVAEDTRALVHAAMRDLNYVRNRAAATLRGSSTGLVGLVINDLRNPFFSEFAASAQMRFAQAGYVTVIANTDEDPTTQHSVVQSMLEHDVSAFLISPCYGDVASTFDAIKRAGIPALQVLREADARSSAPPFFSMEYSHGSALAVQHLLDQGARKIAFIGGRAEHPVAQERRSGYASYVETRGVEPVVLDGRPTRRFGIDAALRLKQEHPEIDAAICFNDLVALGMMSGLARMGLVAGRDLRLIGFDDIEECAEVFPTLSSVHCDIGRFGARSAELLLDWLKNGAAPDRYIPRMPVRLSARATTNGGIE